MWDSNRNFRRLSLADEYFSNEILSQLASERLKANERHAELVKLYLMRDYKLTGAQDMAHQGFLRRLRILVRCIDNVFVALPPAKVELPSDDARTDAEINLHAFVINVYGAVDNLAWIWVLESGLTLANGKGLPKAQVGLRKSNSNVRQSLPVELSDYLTTLDDWFDYLENFRHKVAHQVPLYVPPFYVDPRDEAAYCELGKVKRRAIAAGDSIGLDQADVAQQKLKFFRPWTVSAINSSMRSVAFHGQVLADFNTVHSLGLKISQALVALG